MTAAEASGDPEMIDKAKAAQRSHRYREKKELKLLITFKKRR